MKTLKLLYIIIIISLSFRFGATARAESAYDSMKSEYSSSITINYKQSLIVTPSNTPKPADNADLYEFEDIKRLQEEWRGKQKSSEILEFYPLAPKTLELVKKIYSDEGAIASTLKDDLSLDILVGLALYRNPKILSAQKKIDAALERFSQISNLDLIMRDYVSFTKDLSTLVGPQKNKDMVQMKFPFPGMLTLKGQIVSREIEIARFEFENVQIDVITSLKNLYYDLQYVLKEKEITGKALELLKDLEKVAQIKYETGKTTFNDVIKVQIKIEKFQDTINIISDMTLNLQVQLTQILNLPTETVIGNLTETVASFSHELDSLYKIGLESNRAIEIQRTKIAKMELMIEMAEKKFYPDFTAGQSFYQDNKTLQVGTQGMMETFMTDPMISEPQNSTYATNDAYVREVKESLLGMKEMLKAMSNELTFNIKDAHFHIVMAGRDVKLYKEVLIPKATEALKVARVGYETGTVSFLDVLDADMTWLDMNMKYFGEIKHIETSIARMEQLTGVTLSATGIKGEIQ